MSNKLRTMMRAISEPVEIKPGERPRRRANDTVKLARSRASESRAQADARKVARKLREAEARERPVETDRAVTSPRRAA